MLYWSRGCGLLSRLRGHQEPQSLPLSPHLSLPPAGLSSIGDMHFQGGKGREGERETEGGGRRKEGGGRREEGRGEACGLPGWRGAFDFELRQLAPSLGYGAGGHPGAPADERRAEEGAVLAIQINP